MKRENMIDKVCGGLWGSVNFDEDDQFPRLFAHSVDKNAMNNVRDGLVIPVRVASHRETSDIVRDLIALNAGRRNVNDNICGNLDRNVRGKAYNYTLSNIGFNLLENTSDGVSTRVWLNMRVAVANEVRWSLRSTNTRQPNP